MSYLTIPDQYLEYVPSLQSFVNSFMTFAPLFSYGSTVYSISKHQSSIGFSIDICCTMMVSSILKIFFYTNEPFEISLLRQCFVMIFIQSILLRVALKYRPSNYDADLLAEYPNLFTEFKQRFNTIFQDHSYSSVKLADLPWLLSLGSFYRSVWNLLINIGKLLLWFLFKLFTQIIKLFDVYYRRPLKFWQWENPIVFWKFLGLFVVLVGVLNVCFYKNEHFTLILGTSSLLTESLLPLPQILLLNRVKSVKGFKTILLLSWLGGDFTKISYLIYGTDNVSIIFIILALFQCSLNCFITFQFFYYQKLERRKDALTYLNNDDHESIELSDNTKNIV